MIIDPTTDIGKMRLRCGDYSDFPIMPDSVYEAALEDTEGNLPRAVVTVCQYILGALTAQTHQKLASIEVFGNQWFENYLAFVKATILNPNLMQFAPVPYTPITVDAFGNKVEVPLIQFQKDWNNSYVNGTQSQQMHWMSRYPVHPSYSFIYDGVY